MKLEKIKPGTTLIDEHRHRMGNTTMTELSQWPVLIVSIDLAAGTAVVRWNGNREQKWSRRQFERLRPFLSAAYMREHPRTESDDPYENAAHYMRRLRRTKGGPRV